MIRFEKFSGKKFRCSYSYKGEIVAQHSPTRHGKSGSSKDLNKAYSLGFSFGGKNTLILTNLDGMSIKALATEKDQIPVSMLECYHVSLERQHSSGAHHLH